MKFKEPNLSSSKKAIENETEEQAFLRDRLKGTLDARLERERTFKLENADAFASANAWVEENGLPLAKYRQF